MSSRAPLEAFTPAQVKFSGEPVELSPKHTLALSLALHELATNATKYGALSCPGGSVNLAWAAREGKLRLDWEENGGPPWPRQPEQGFGTRLLKVRFRATSAGT